MIKYIFEIRNRIFLIFLTWISVILVSYFYKETLLFLIVQPSKFLLFEENSYLFYFIFTSITEVLTIYFDVIIFLSYQVVVIYFIYHCFVFFGPALFKNEYNFILNFLKFSFLMCLLAIIIYNFFLISVTWNFFIGFQSVLSSNFINLHFESKLKEYFNFYVTFYSLTIFYCQIFTILCFVLTYSKHQAQFIKKLRKVYYYCFFCVATLISPPDIIIQIFISIIIIFIYEAFVFTIILKKNLVN